ncbi:MAG: hypothetical protein KDK91_02550 [Gammaproteobacteria bacterium]|nr:hypothetical protein [Gammaproteobacteria bacterium]
MMLPGTIPGVDACARAIDLRPVGNRAGHSKNGTRLDGATLERRNPRLLELLLAICFSQSANQRGREETSCLMK